MPGRLLAERGLSDLFDAATDADNADYGGAVRSLKGGYFSGAVLGAIVPVCTFENGLERVELHPARLQGRGVGAVHRVSFRAEGPEPVASLSTWTSSRRRSGLISRSRTALG